MRALEEAGLVTVSASGSDRRTRAARLLPAASAEIRPVAPEHPDAQHCLAEYVAELNPRSTRRFDPTVGATALSQEVCPPAGQLFVVHLHGEAIGCGASITAIRPRRPSECGSHPKHVG